MAQQQQPQYQMPAQLPVQMPGPVGPSSPAQAAPSPGAQAFYQPAAKRQRLSPDPRSQPTSPYTQSPYGPTPSTAAPPSSLPPAHSSHFANISQPPTYQGPYSNGHTTPALSHPSPYSQPPTYNPNAPPVSNVHAMPSHSPHQPHPPHPTNVPTSNQFPNNYSMPPQQQQQQQQQHQQHGAGAMGPPSKPAERDNVNDDQMDVLANAGVDLRAEESFAMSFHTGSFNSQPAFNQAGLNATGHGFTQFGPGDAGSFYGSGPANQPGAPIDKATQDQIQKKTADQAWADAAYKLAMSRQHELKHPHVHVGALWNKMDKIAKENGLVLNTDNGKMPQLKLPSEFPSEIKIETRTGPDGALVVANTTFLPQDTALADQLALMSLATNQRIRILLEETIAIVKSRRVGSHGVIPSEWSDVAASSTSAAGTVVPEGAPRTGWESAVSPGTNPTNDPASAAGRLPTPVSEGTKTPTGTVTMTNELIKSLREAANVERNFEEKRLAKRQGRPTDGTVARSGSAAPGTPGTVAPEPSTKPLTKKEREKQDKGKQNLVDSHAQANATTATFLFGGKKKNKYSWMDSGGGSGASTPGRTSMQAPGTPGGIGGGVVEKVRLTADGKNRMGGFREDKDGGRLVQLRDFLAVLENDGREKKTLQRTYAWLEGPKPKPTVA
ncbi:hypothetical protein V499_06762 [Pseudogymnoascus sp. VKM F-103]|nr:hypothetical protein V499_06762 [Pseudogymnoascus sp. VKM F-103]